MNATDTADNCTAMLLCPNVTHAFVWNGEAVSAVDIVVYAFMCVVVGMLIVLTISRVGAMAVLLGVGIIGYTTTRVGASVLWAHLPWFHCIVCTLFSVVCVYCQRLHCRAGRVDTLDKQEPEPEKQE